MKFMSSLNLATDIFASSQNGSCFGMTDSMVGSILISTNRANNMTCVDKWGLTSISFAHRKNWEYSREISLTYAALFF